MKFNNPQADSFVPDGLPVEAALARTTHMGVGAHQDDLEIMAYHGIVQCYRKENQWFSGVTCTNGSGSPRKGPYADVGDEEMIQFRKSEQRQAALVGEFGVMIQLDYPSGEIKNPSHMDLVDDLFRIISVAQPEFVYTHNPADKHDTHIAVLVCCIEALRRLPHEHRPKKLYGCEVWRDLDWLLPGSKVLLDVGDRENLAAALLGVFDSQIAGGKRYDLATFGRRRANATFLDSHGVDLSDQVTYAMDLSPLLHSNEVDLVDYVSELLQSFKIDVEEKLQRYCRNYK